MIYLIPCWNPCRLYIHLAFTYPIGPSSVVWSELGLAPPFPLMRVLARQWAWAMSLVREVVLKRAIHASWLANQVAFQKTLELIWISYSFIKLKILVLIELSYKSLPIMLTIESTMVTMFWARSVNFFWTCVFVVPVLLIPFNIGDHIIVAFNLGTSGSSPQCSLPTNKSTNFPHWGA